MSREKIKAWIQASRPPFYIATLAPISIGVILAKGQGLRMDRIFLILIGSFIVHLVTNIANDYFDYKKGTDDGAAIGGSRVIQEGKISPKTLLNTIIVLYVLAFIVAFVIMYFYDLFILLPMILFAAFSSFFYVAPPVRYGYHALGELFVGINMGPIMVVGTYWVMAERFDWAPLFISLPVGFMVASILYYQSLPDMETDLMAHKITLAVKLGKKGAYICLILFWVVIYLGIVLLMVFQLLSLFSLFFIASIPVFLKMVRIVREAKDWVILDQHGKYVRILYGLNSIAIILGLKWV
ncbi:MAG: 1,4-dihydroxy-2-naphthoate octaprenyltransferase [Syntrophorhabdaceae bacterium]|nr:1,4-dihydroxy-2-naphthoate octaprenyltransferase [Syntrophorhabdaceae bacterium]